MSPVGPAIQQYEHDYASFEQGYQEALMGRVDKTRRIDLPYDIGWRLGFHQAQIDAIQQRLAPRQIESERPEDV